MAPYFSSSQFKWVRHGLRDFCRYASFAISQSEAVPTVLYPAVTHSKYFAVPEPVRLCSYLFDKLIFANWVPKLKHSRHRLAVGEIFAHSSHMIRFNQLVARGLTKAKQWNPVSLKVKETESAFQVLIWKFIIRCTRPGIDHSVPTKSRTQSLQCEATAWRFTS